MEKNEGTIQNLPVAGNRWEDSPAFDETLPNLQGKKPGIEEDQFSTTAYMKRVFS
jgi:hypothetical protein